MKNKMTLSFLVSALICLQVWGNQLSDTLTCDLVDLMSDTWVGTDALGRRIPINNGVGENQGKKNRANVGVGENQAKKNRKNVKAGKDKGKENRRNVKVGERPGKENRKNNIVRENRPKRMPWDEYVGDLKGKWKPKDKKEDGVYLRENRKDEKEDGAYLNINNKDKHGGNAAAKGNPEDNGIREAAENAFPVDGGGGTAGAEKNRTVGIFYITWHTQNLHDLPGPYTDVSKILAEDASARLDGNHPLWKYGSYHWGEPESGYFLSQDEWVIRRDMSMLADAGVDVLVLDVTNGVCYWDEWEKLFSTMETMRAEGNMTPKFVFWSYNGGPIGVVKSLYERIYREKRYSDLWFYWDGRPLLLYNADPSYDANGTYDNVSAADYPQEIRDFFTLRNMWWGYYEWHGRRFIGTEDNWSFGYSMADSLILNMSPEELVSKHGGLIEEAAVTPAQHPVTMTADPMGVGKSWSRYRGEPALNDRDLPSYGYIPWLGESVPEPEGYGIYFQERWDDALRADPPFIYLNDWNEWTAGMYERGKATPWLGRLSSYIFIDQYNSEFNRTIQPMRGGYSDNYYMQMVANIRRYKGARPIPVTRGYNRETIYRDTRGDTAHRDHDGYAGLHYTDTTGRNDITECRVAVDRNYVTFTALTAEALSPETDPNWMLLLLDTDCDASTGWEGYDFLVRGDEILHWSDVESKWLMRGYVQGRDVSGRCLRLSVPRGLIRKDKREFQLDFKWTDNATALDNIITVATTGDTAPNRRFNYRLIFTME